MPESKQLYPRGLFESSVPLPNVHRYRVSVIDPACQKRFDVVYYLNAYAGIVIDRNEAERAIRDELRERVVKKYIDETCLGTLNDVLRDKWYWVWSMLEMKGCTIEIEEKAPELPK